MEKFSNNANVCYTNEIMQSNHSKGTGMSGSQSRSSHVTYNGPIRILDDPVKTQDDINNLPINVG